MPVLQRSHLIQKLFALNDLERGITVNVGTIDGGISETLCDVRAINVIDPAYHVLLCEIVGNQLGIDLVAVS